MAPELTTIDSELPKPRDPRALNAYRHGLTGQVVVIPPAEKVAYESHCHGIHQSFNPKGAMETDMVQFIADDLWRLKRAAALEANIFAVGLTDPDEVTAHHEQIDTALAMTRVWRERSKELERLTLYEGRLQRKVDKNLAILRQLQQDRLTALEKLVEESSILGETYELPAELLPPQFDFSSPQIARLAAHHHRLSQAKNRPTPAKFPSRESRESRESLESEARQ